MLFALALLQKVIMSLQVQNGWNYQNNKIGGLPKQIWKLFSLYKSELTRKASYQRTKTPLYSPFTIFLEWNKNIWEFYLNSHSHCYLKKRHKGKKNRYKCPIGSTSITTPFFTLFWRRVQKLSTSDELKEHLEIKNRDFFCEMTYILTLSTNSCLNSDATDILLLSQLSKQNLNTTFGRKISNLQVEVVQNSNFAHIRGQWNDSIDAWRPHMWTVILFQHVFDENWKKVLYLCSETWNQMN